MLAKTGPLMKFELAFSARGIVLDDIRARDVRGHQVRGELDAVEAEVQGLGHGTDQQGLGQSGHAHEERVAPGKQGDAQKFHDALLADNDLA